MLKRGEMGGFGGGSLEHPRQWLGAQRPGLFLGVPEPPGAFRRALRRHTSRAGALARLRFDHAEVRKSSSVMRPAPMPQFAKRLKSTLTSGSRTCNRRWRRLQP